MDKPSGAVGLALLSCLVVSAGAIAGCSKRKPPDEKPPLAAVEDHPVEETKSTPAVDEMGGDVVKKLLETWKVGDHAASLWKDGKERTTLFAVRDYAPLKTTTGDEAKLAWIRVFAVLEAERVRASTQVEPVKPLLDIQSILEGDKALLKQYAPGTYAAHRFRIKSSNKAGVAIEVLWDIVLEKVGSGWKVVGVIESQ